ncbi:dephospho-CoA kinase [Actinoplanes sp. NPDC051470]|uniref:dephospho-CoA kinase n=1 Tax=Actinoplanes sp. NPDC051470 TaxID=3157224 RepID=UPI003441129F
MLKVGLTGGIGAGKSAVAARLARRGAVIVDSDKLAREVVAAGTDGLAEVVAAFGDGVLGPGGELDRPALGAKVFGDDEARHRLEKIIHPRVRARAHELAAAAPADAILVNDVPLLVETGQAPSYHLVLVVTADLDTRVRRLAETRGMPADQARSRIAAQASDAERAAVADVLIPNDSALDELDAFLAALWRDRLVPFEENLRLGRAASGDRAVPPARLVARVQHALGAEARITVSGSDLIVEAGAADQADRLTAAGFPRIAPGEFASADPGCPVTVRVRAEGPQR